MEGMLTEDLTCWTLYLSLLNGMRINRKKIDLPKEVYSR